MQPNGPNQHTQQPIVTGTSVVAIKFQDGVVIAADNLGTQFPSHPTRGAIADADQKFAILLALVEGEKGGEEEEEECKANRAS